MSKVKITVTTKAISKMIDCIMNSEISNFSDNLQINSPIIINYIKLKLKKSIIVYDDYMVPPHGLEPQTY